MKIQLNTDSRLSLRTNMHAGISSRLGQMPPVKGLPTGTVVELTPKECTYLGGTVKYWDGCGTLMKCVAANGREMCIDELS
jgi:hypothetical protein